MQRVEKEQLIWSYLDDDISIKERLKIDQLRVKNEEFEALYRELADLHEDLRRLPLEEVTVDFKKRLEANILKELALGKKGFSINPLIGFGLSLVLLGFTFSFLGNDASSHVSFLPDLHFDQLQFPIFERILTGLNNIQLDLNWLYFTVFLLAPSLFFWDKFAEGRFSVRQYMFA